MSPEIDEFLDKCVKKSLGYDPNDDKYSIMECLKNQYLHPNYDPFEMLSFDLLALTIRAKYGIEY